jgi:hypothetical protein
MPALLALALKEPGLLIAFLIHFFLAILLTSATGEDYVLIPNTIQWYR